MSSAKAAPILRRIDSARECGESQIVLQITLDAAPLLAALRGSAGTEVVPTPQPLLTQEETAQFCRCSVRHFRRLRDDGLPTLWLGESPRFDREAVLAWLRMRSVK